MLLKKILSDTETNLLQRENHVIIAVHFDPKENVVTDVAYVHVVNGNFQFITDITKIFCEQMNGDAFIDSIDWREEMDTEDLKDYDEQEFDSRLAFGTGNF